MVVAVSETNSSPQWLRVPQWVRTFFVPSAPKEYYDEKPTISEEAKSLSRPRAQEEKGILQTLKEKAEAGCKWIADTFNSLKELVGLAKKADKTINNAINNPNDAKARTAAAEDAKALLKTAVKQDAKRKGESLEEIKRKEALIDQMAVDELLAEGRYLISGLKDVAKYGNEEMYLAVLGRVTDYLSRIGERHSNPKSLRHQAAEMLQNLGGAFRKIHGGRMGIIGEVSEGKANASNRGKLDRAGRILGKEHKLFGALEGTLGMDSLSFLSGAAAEVSLHLAELEIAANIILKVAADKGYTLGSGSELNNIVGTQARRPDGSLTGLDSASAQKLFNSDIFKYGIDFFTGPHLTEEILRMYAERDAKNARLDEKQYETNLRNKKDREIEDLKKEVERASVRQSDLKRLFAKLDVNRMLTPEEIRQAISQINAAEKDLSRQAVAKA